MNSSIGHFIDEILLNLRTLYAEFPFSATGLSMIITSENLSAISEDSAFLLYPRFF